MKADSLRIRKFESFLKKIRNETYPEPPSSLHTAITEKMIDSFFLNYTLPVGSRILDVGCGQGMALEIFKKRGFSPVGITTNNTDFQKCRQKNLEVLEMDQSFLNFVDEVFDFIWCRHSLEHSFFPYLTLCEFFRVLKKQGYLYIEVPAPDTVSCHQSNRNHYSVLGKSMWIELIRRSGFTILDMHHIHVNLKIGSDIYWSFIQQKPYLF